MGVVTTAECSVRGPGCRGEQRVFGSGGVERLRAEGWRPVSRPSSSLGFVRWRCPECVAVGSLPPVSAPWGPGPHVGSGVEVAGERELRVGTGGFWADAVPVEAGVVISVPGLPAEIGAAGRVVGRLPDMAGETERVCGECGQAFASGDVLQVVWPGDGRARHTDCDDPRLERQAD